MIKLIASDVDGTLLQDGAHTINEEYFEVIRQLRKKGIFFAVASGRQFPSICRLFEPVKDEVFFIAENGAYVVCRDRDIAVTPMNRAYVEELVEQMRGMSDCILTASGKEATYIESRDEDFLDLLVNGYHNEVRVVEDVLKADTTIIKLALYCKTGIDPAAKLMVPQWQDKVKAVVAGGLWLDFMDKSVDKGKALSTLQYHLNVTKEETMVFGDNFNDIGMFMQAAQSYAVATAKPEVKQNAAHVIEGFESDGVLKVLKTL